jgi:hypothetical protein
MENLRVMMSVPNVIASPLLQRPTIAYILYELMSLECEKFGS